MLWKMAFLIVFLLWSMLRSVYARKIKESSTKTSLHKVSEKGLVFLNFITMVVLPALLVFTPFLDGFSFGLPAWLRGIALLIMTLSIFLFGWTHHALGRFWSPVLEIREEHRLIETGPYAYVRHPMYAQLWIWVFAQGLVLDNYFLAVSGVGAWALLYFIRVPREEAMLLAEFGEQYQRYSKRTGRILPLFCANCTQSS